VFDEGQTGATLYFSVDWRWRLLFGSADVFEIVRPLIVRQQYE
jgi:hypothetical protein